MKTPKSEDSDLELQVEPHGEDETSEPDLGLTSHLNPDGTPRIIERHLIVPPELAGLRLDHFVKTQISRLSRTKIQQIIDTQLTRISGTTAKSSTTVVAGDHFVIRRPARAEPACPRRFDVVHEDARMLVIDKPAGLPVHASAKFYFNTLTRVLGERFPDEPEIQICHRLDRETSGCLVVARDREAAAFLKQAIANKHKTTKEYLAVVHGQPPWDTEAALDAPLRISTEADATRIATVRVIAGPGGAPSLTRVRVERRGARFALVRCRLVTGRQHQIRVHLADAGFPIVGDKIYTHGDDAFIEYCDEGLTPELAELFILPRHALHASRIIVPHPSGSTITAEAPLPADMADLL
ncbi:MAG: pseudouridine synthase, RluA family [Myxococcales bacterium]|nr:pseudouridine synthase, RluA family [Myxococcales bacterium]